MSGIDEETHLRLFEISLTTTLKPVNTQYEKSGEKQRVQQIGPRGSIPRILYDYRDGLDTLRSLSITHRSHVDDILSGFHLIKRNGILSFAGGGPVSNSIDTVFESDVFRILISQQRKFHRERTFIVWNLEMVIQTIELSIADNKISEIHLSHFHTAILNRFRIEDSDTIIGSKGNQPVSRLGNCILNIFLVGQSIAMDMRNKLLILLRILPDAHRRTDPEIIFAVRDNAIDNFVTEILRSWEFGQLILDTVVDKKAVVGSDEDISLTLFTKRRTHIAFQQNALPKLLELARLGVHTRKAITRSNPEHTVSVNEHCFDPVVAKRVSSSILCLHENLGRFTRRSVIDDHSLTIVTEIKPSLPVIGHAVHTPSIESLPVLTDTCNRIIGIKGIQGTQPPMPLPVVVDEIRARGRSKTTNDLTLTVEPIDTIVLDSTKQIACRCIGFNGRHTTADEIVLLREIPTAKSILALIQLEKAFLITAQP